MKLDWQETLMKILLANTASLRELALIAGGDPKTFYRTADFSGVDLNSIDTRGVGLPQSLKHSMDDRDRGAVRLIVNINPIVHSLIKRGNPGALSSHISVLIRVFLDEHVAQWMERRMSSRRLERELLEELLSGFAVKGGGVRAFGRRTSSYNIESSLKDRLSEAAVKAGKPLSEMGRIAIYFCLLFDPVRNYKIYSAMIREFALSEYLEEGVRVGSGDYMIVQRAKDGKATYVQIRRTNDGRRFVQVVGGLPSEKK